MIEQPFNDTEHPELFRFPDIEAERGEIERTAEDYFPGVDKDAFAKEFITRAKSGRLEPFSEDQWKKLENTDSLQITPGDWETVKHCAEKNTPPRDWQSLRADIENGVSVKAPIIVRKDAGLHLVAGNTRLMVARALGTIPDVLVVDMSDYEK